MNQNNPYSRRSGYFDKTEGKLAGLDKIEVEVILLERTKTDVLVQRDEDSIAVRIPLKHAKVKRTLKGITTLSMSENRAIHYDLV